jgi:hypothetical protein
VGRRDQLKRLYGTTENDEYQAVAKEFEAAVRSVAHAFPLLDPATNRIFTLKLNQHNGRFDGFRFRNNSSEPKNFGWVIACEGPRSLQSWGMVPLETQPIPGLSRAFETRLAYTNAPWSHLNGIELEVSQYVRDKSILPQKEYVMWFAFPDSRANTIHFVMDLFPITKELGSVSLDEAFGLKGPIRYPEAFLTRPPLQPQK